ncbi:MAG: flagellar motor switch protein FliN/FliY [Planctomycetota bacterium]|jgi:flagellar motor switch protein FliN/FliY
MTQDTVDETTEAVDSGAAKEAVQEEATVSDVAAVDFEDFQSPGNTSSPGASSENLGRVMDVKVPMTARIGIVNKTISDVIDLVPGSIVDLERNAGEPIDLVIGDKLIARGEIVVVKDRYGVRIVEVIQDD